MKDELAERRARISGQAPPGARPAWRRPGVDRTAAAVGNAAGLLQRLAVSGGIVNRRFRRTLERLLRDERCGSCGGELDGKAHEAELHAPSGQIFIHFVCAPCVREGRSGPDGHRAVIERARLRLVPAEGRA